MFEQATLTNGPAGKRVWTTMLGVTTQVALVSFAVLVPMVWPQVLPTARFLETLAPPLPPPAPRPLGGEAKQRPSRPVMVRVSRNIYIPQIIPDRIPIIVDEPTGPMAVGIPQTFGGPSTGGVGSIADLVPGVSPVVAPPVARPMPKPASIEPAPIIRRYKEGGNVKLGAALNRVQPPYPPLARATHTFGNVELECVVGVNGRIQDVKVRSGNPLLVKAAVEAAWQWVYAPSKLNDMPIEIVTILTFSFKLN